MNHTSRACAALRKRIKTSTFFQDWADCCSGLLEDDTMCLLAVELSVNACLAAGGKAPAAIPVGAAWLVLNRAAYLMDGSQDREISLSSREAQNRSMALFFAACNLLSDVSAEYSSQVLHVVSEAGFEAVMGQRQGFTLTEGTSTEEALKNYWGATVLKSGSLFRMATAGGAAVATHNQAIIQALGAYGTALGIIHQMLDDCRDALDGKDGYEITLPAIFYSSAIKSQRVTFPPIRNGKGLLKILDETEALPMISNAFLYWQQRGLESLAGLESSDAVEELKRLLKNTVPEEFIQVNT